MTKLCRNKSLFPIFLIVEVFYLLVVSPSSGCADIPLTAPQVLADFKAASGGSTWDTVNTVITNSLVKQGGLSGVDESWQDILTGRYSDRYTLAGVTASDGFDGQRSWTIDSSGISRYSGSEEDEESALTNSYLVSLSYWYGDRRPGALDTVQQTALGKRACNVVTVEPEGGYPTDLWFDSSTHLLVRSVEHTSLKTVTTDFSDFRKVDGITLPFSSTVSTGDSKYDLTIKAKSVVVNSGVPLSTFSPPQTDNVDYTIAGGAKSVTVPFTTSIGHIFVPVKINGRGPFEAILDTGGRLAITPEFAHDNKISSRGSLPGSGTGPSTVSEAIGTISTLQIGDVTISGLPVIVLSMPTPANTLLIGDEIFKRFVVKIDFDKQLLTLTPLNTYVYARSGMVQPFKFAGDIPEISGTVDGIGGEFMIDTGSGNSVDIFPAFSKEHDLAYKYHPAFVTNSGYGIGGAQTAGVARAASFALGQASGSNVLIYLSNASAGSFSDTSLAGNVGIGFLHKFNLTFDYGRQQITFEPNSHTAEPDSYERMGVSFDASNDGCVITDVIPGSPADVAGIKIGDIITSANGNKLRMNDALWMENQILQPAGTSLDVKVKQGRGTREITIVLRDLI